MSGQTFFGRFHGARFFGRPYWGPRPQTGGDGPHLSIDDLRRLLREPATTARERRRRKLLLAALAVLSSED